MVLSLIMSLSHIAKIHIILIKQTIISKKRKEKETRCLVSSVRNFPSYSTTIQFNIRPFYYFLAQL